MVGLSRLPGALAVCGLLLALRGGAAPAGPGLELEITDFHVRSTVVSRYAVTSTRSVVHNPYSAPHEAVFDVELPNTAFISNFTLTVNGKVYPAVVQEKAKAQRIYQTARSRGQTAAHVGTRGRETDRFRVSLTVEPSGCAEFGLTHEELLQRRLGRYELALGVRPRQVVPNLTLEVVISEGGGIDRLSVLPLRTSSLLTKQLNESSGAPPSTVIERTPTCARVTFSPTPEQQVNFSRRGIAGEFVVHYDVPMPNLIGDIQTQDGYFVHYVSPRDLPVIAKNIIFVIDVSSSMYGTKIQQMREAMNTILGDLRPGDFFNIVTFSDLINVWSANHSVRASPETVRAARAYVNGVEAVGWTDINGALLAGAEAARHPLPPPPGLPPHVPSLDPPILPLVLFLTDGEATSGVTEAGAIVRNARQALSVSPAGPISLYCLGLGDDADLGLLRRLSAANRGASRRLYEEEDARQQLEGFYHEVGSPTLLGLRLDYEGGGPPAGVSFPAFFAGSELAVAGALADTEGRGLSVRLRATGRAGSLDLQARPKAWDQTPAGNCPGGPSPGPGFIQRLWAYLEVKELLRERLREESEVGRRRLTEQATGLALQYGFVTPVTAMVVVRPGVGAGLAVTTGPGPSSVTGLGPSDTSLGPSTTGPGPSLDTGRGPPSIVPRPSATAPGPLATSLGLSATLTPSGTSLRPSDTTLGPSTMTPGPSDTSLGPSDTTLEPSTTTPGPSDTTPGPSTTAPSSRLHFAISTTDRPGGMGIASMLRSGGILVQAKLDLPDEEDGTDYFYGETDGNLDEEDGMDYFYRETDGNLAYVPADLLSASVSEPAVYPYSVDGDPHFVVRIADSNESVCFTIDGQAGDIVSLIEDPLSGVKASGHLQGAPANPEDRERARNFFDWILVEVGASAVNVSQDGITLEGAERLALPWRLPSLTSRPGLEVEVSRSGAATLRFGKGLEFLVLLHRYPRPSALQRSHLGLYIIRGDGLSPQARGLLGQFQHADLHLQPVVPDGGGAGTPGLALLVHGGRSVRVRSVWKALKDSALPAHPAPCWVLSREGVRRLLGLSYADYLLPPPAARTLT